MLRIPFPRLDVAKALINILQLVIERSPYTHYYNGNPSGNVVGNIGDICINTGGGAGTTLYLKESGENTNTGWVAK